MIEEYLSEKELLQKRKNATRLENEFHKSYGKFCLTFELMVNRLRESVVSIFEFHGLKDKELIKAVIANDTADSVQEKCKMTIYRHYEWNSEMIAILKPIFVYVRELTNFRNNLVHGSWVPQIAYYEEDRAISGQLPRSRSNHSSTVDKFSISTKQLKDVEKDCLGITGILLQLQSSILEKTDLLELKQAESYQELPEMRARLEIKEDKD